MGFWGGRSTGSVRDTGGLRERSVIGIIGLLALGTLTQGVTYSVERQSDAAVSALSRVSRLSAAAAEVEMVARRLEREPDVQNHKRALATIVDELESEEASLSGAEFDSPVDNTGWARVSLALASLNAEAHAIDVSASIAPRAAQRLRARAVALSDEVVATRAQLDADIEDSGAGQLAKSVNQICIAGIVQGLSEGLHFAAKAGLDPAKVIGAISGGAAQSWQMDNRWKTMVEEHFEHGFAVDWMRKDLRITLDAARENGASLPLTAMVDQYYADVQAMGGARWDTSSLIARLKRLDKKE